MTGPLAGVRIVDLSAVLSGPIATQILADQGADVVKVEPHRGGDVLRSFGATRNGVGATFAVVNRNKRSIAMDLKSSGGRRVLESLVASADVLVENFRPGVLDRLGFGYAAVRRLNPRIIYGSISGFGVEGPCANRRAYDPIVQGMSGLATIQADPETGTPGLVRTAICDKVTSLYFCQALTAALYARERSGQGERIDLTMLDAAVAFSWPEAMYNHTFLEEFEPVPEFSTIDPIFEASDGRFVIAALSDHEYAGLWRAVGRPELIDDPRVATMSSRGGNAAFIRAQIGEAVRAVASDELEAALIREDVPATRINTRASLVRDPQVAVNGSVIECEHPKAGRMRQPRQAAMFATSPTSLPRAAPSLGEHTEAVLSECGFSAAEVGALIASGEVFQS